METTNCPYCSEEVAAAAKKCKHCGEWLDKQPKSTEVQSSSISHEPINYALYNILCYAAMGFSLASFIYNLDGVFDYIDAINVKDENRLLVQILSFIPQWVVTLGETTLWVVLLLAINKYSKCFTGHEKVPFTFLIVMETILGVFNLLIDLMNDDSMEEIVLTVALLAYIIYAIIMIITGIRLLHLKESPRLISLGIAFIVYAGAIIIYYVAFFMGIFNDDIIIADILLFIALLYPLGRMQVLFSKGGDSEECEI